MWNMKKSHWCRIKYHCGNRVFFFTFIFYFFFAVKRNRTWGQASMWENCKRQPAAWDVWNCRTQLNPLFIQCGEQLPLVIRSRNSRKIHRSWSSTVYHASFNTTQFILRRFWGLIRHNPPTKGPFLSNGHFIFIMLQFCGHIEHCKCRYFCGNILQR